MTSYTVESNVDIPARGYSRGRPLKYPFDELLEARDSFFVPDAAPCVAVAAFGYAKRHGFKVTTRQVVEKGKKGMRVWRV